MKHIIAVLGLIGAISFLPAANHYVRQGATGNGSDWTNAYGDLPASLVRGDTYYIADGSYGAYTFDDATQGTTTPGIIQKAVSGDHGTDVGWKAEYGDGQAVFVSFTFVRSNWVIDGVTGGGPAGWEEGHGIRVHGGGKLARFDEAVSNITIKHVDFQHNGRDTHDSNADIVYGTSACQDVSFSYCAFRDVARVMFLISGWDGLTIEYCKFSRNGRNDGIHREAMSCSADDNVTIRYCIFEEIANTAVIAHVNGSGTAENWQIYGNVFSTCAVSALIRVKYVSPTTVKANNWVFYNNTVVNFSGIPGFSISSGTNITVYNNIWYHNTANDLAVNFTHDYNWYYDNWRKDRTPAINLDAKVVEAHEQIGTANPLVNWTGGDFNLKSATNAGMSLAVPYNKDMFGRIRGQDGTWDRGAMEYDPSQTTSIECRTLNPRLQSAGAGAECRIHPAPNLISDGRFYNILGQQVREGDKTGPYLIPMNGKLKIVMLVK